MRGIPPPTHPLTPAPTPPKITPRFANNGLRDIPNGRQAVPRQGRRHHSRRGIPGDEGDAIEFDQVLMLSQDGNVSVGAPTVDGARVTAEVVGKGRAKKIIVFKYKAKTRYRRKNGHRQHYTDLRVINISKN